ncbi:MAG: tRNA (N(6)-L-threonylcarbamoyladenosine(37)-C(2))-methylthiotransferase MtaB [Limnochordia bacterium]|nr:tRNA (N(6)-L-threonylcarbamoyladenosine(37)-C(2))-methylthiotransferase MtaB [Limnochordia bacterium]MDD2628729.1 tRNA (N(6)-L-threonylcarbamoyladenosine(37)-C(2))-methylthiotransferase MtaB [Limnochordia bacterium]MDD4517155.1 tRNA (N(6)-L-threonylcarbamoyladenosine(37)-C(2))-methylthiotransferase MtaB [Limnochordia bacterium]
MAQGKKVAGFTLGCKVNQYDTEAVLELFEREGYKIVNFDESADVYVINTCTVTVTGDRKSRQAVRRAVRENPKAVVAVMGCYAQVEPEEVARIPGVDVVVGTQNRSLIPELVAKVQRTRRQYQAVEGQGPWDYENLSVKGLGDRTRATVKIQDGCDRRCTYCRVPFARGPARSRAPESVLEEIATLENLGYREIVLTGVNLGTYGQEFGAKRNLRWLLEQITQSFVGRIRVSSLEPQELDDGLIEFMATTRGICHHLHMPLQSGDEQILHKMGRLYTLEEFAHFADLWRSLAPRGALTADVIVGFPGENAESFARTCAFIRKLAFSGLHIFRYSRRKGTAAARFPHQVTGAVKSERARVLEELARELQRDFWHGLVGEKFEVLLETEKDGFLTGFTDNYVQVKVPGTTSLLGQLQQVMITEVKEDQVYGQIH